MRPSTHRPRPRPRAATGCSRARSSSSPRRPGPASARRRPGAACEEGASVLVSDAHERRLAETAEQLAGEAGRGPCPRAGLRRAGRGAGARALRRRGGALRPHRRGGAQRRARRHGAAGGDDRRAVVDRARHHADRHLPLHPRRARAMLPQKAGVIVNNASVLGWRAQPGQAHYAAAKAGVMALTRSRQPRRRRPASASMPCRPAWPSTPS